MGLVYLFHAPPEQETIEVQAPLFGDLNDAPDELVVHLSEEDSSPNIDRRIGELADGLDLTKDQLRLASSVGLEHAVALKKLVEVSSRRHEPIHWSGYPRYKELEAVCQLICKIRSPAEFGMRSAKQLTYFLSDLCSSRTMRDFFRGYSRSYRGEASAQDSIFKFLRSCEYGLPQLLSVVELFATRLDRSTNYSLFLSEMPRWFRPEVLKNLDEQGVPI